MKTIWIEESQLGKRLNEEMIRDHFEVELDPNCADICIQFCVPGPPERASRTIVCYMEPPISMSYAVPWTAPELFHTVYLWYPNGAAVQSPNVFALTEDPAAFPTDPLPGEDIQRPITELRNRAVYYAGGREMFPEGGEICGRINLYPVRDALIEGLLAAGHPMKVYGDGWGQETRRKGDFRLNKFTESQGCDFVFAGENSMLPGYISEKIHDGFLQDRVVLYLGEPHVERWIPREAFFDLRPAFNRRTRQIDVEAVLELVRECPQVLYDKTLAAAREWRRSGLDVRWALQRDRLTQHIIERIGP